MEKWVSVEHPLDTKINKNDAIVITIILVGEIMIFPAPLFGVLYCEFSRPILKLSLSIVVAFVNLNGGF